MPLESNIKDHLLLISDRPEDYKFFQHLCSQEGGLVLHRTLNVDEIRTVVSANPQTVVVWDSQNASFYAQIQGWLGKYVRTNRLFAYTNESLNNYIPFMRKFPIFGNFMARREDPVSMEVYGKIMRTTLDEEAFGIKRYVPLDAKIRTIQIKKSNHKSAVIEAIQNVLSSSGVKSRVAALVAQSTDELILNAIFDAPLNPEGVRYKAKVAKDAEFELDDAHEIQVSIATAPHYMAVSVRDQFGSLPREKVISAFTSKTMQTGLSRILHGGISLLFVCKPRARTEVMIFFRLTDNYKDFKKSFHFVSTVIYAPNT
jgi:hypothetical protein